MPAFTTKLIHREEIARGTMAFHFAKPADFAFKSGQTMDLTLLNPPHTDAEGNKRTFSITATPDETELSIATRTRDTAFKNSLREIPLGTELTLEGPFGSLTLHNDISKRAVFLAGGIGITPFYSMAKDANNRALPHHIFLFYSNKTPADTAFLNELAAIGKQNQNFKLVLTFTDLLDEKPALPHETSYINQMMLQKYLTDFSHTVYYIAGPPTMVASLKKTLNESGIDDDDIKTEDFTGY